MPPAAVERDAGPGVPRRLVRLLSRIEAMGLRASEEHWASIPPDLAKRARPGVVRVGDGLLTMLGSSGSLRRNRVTGLGHRGRATEAMIDEIVARYRAAGIPRFSVEPAPGPQAEDVAGWLLARGFRRHGGSSLLVRRFGPPIPRAAAGVRVARACRDQAPTMVRIQEAAFGMPASRRAWALASAASSGYETFLAFVGRAVAGSGILRVEGDLTWLGGGATLTRWRRRGVHGALIAARLRRGARAGCRWAWVETAAPTPGRPQGSRRNLIRFGFQEACIKPSFVWSRR